MSNCVSLGWTRVWIAMGCLATRLLRAGCVMSARAMCDITQQLPALRLLLPYDHHPLGFTRKQLIHAQLQLSSPGNKKALWYNDGTGSIIRLQEKKKNTTFSFIMGFRTKVWKIAPLKVQIKMHHRRHDERAHLSTTDCQKVIHRTSHALQIGWLWAGGEGKGWMCLVLSCLPSKCSRAIRAEAQAAAKLNLWLEQRLWSQLKPVQTQRAVHVHDHKELGLHYTQILWQWNWRVLIFIYLFLLHCTRIVHSGISTAAEIN